MRKTQGVKFSLRFLLLLNVVFTCTAAGLAYVSRVPSVAEEVNAWLGRASNTTNENDRTTQVIFVFAVYAMPLFMAIVVWLVTLAFQWLQSFQPLEQQDPED